MAELLKNLLSSLGITANVNALLLIASLIAFLLGFYLARVLSARQQNSLKREFEQSRNNDQAQFDDQLDQLSHTFSSLSNEALRHNNESFLTLATQSFSQLQSNANNDLKNRERSFANLIQPIKQSIEQTDKQLRQLE